MTKITCFGVRHTTKKLICTLIKEHCLLKSKYSHSEEQDWHTRDGVIRANGVYNFSKRANKQKIALLENKIISTL